MTEREINERRNWKAEVFPYDYYLPDDSPECLYCLTDKQAELLRGIIMPLGWRTRWWTNEDSPIDKDTIETFRDDLVRRLIMSCCNDDNPILYRWTVDGILQKSTDDGETWEDAPENDPRNNSAVYPPIEGDDGDDKKCLAATSARDLIREQIGENITEDMSRFTLGELIKTWVDTYLQTSNPFLAIIQIAVNQIFALVLSLLIVALTDEVYDTLMCIFYQNMGDDASFSEGQWTNVRSDILAQIAGIAGLFFEHLVYLLGAIGLTNIARSEFATEGDCDDCTENCDLDNWAVKIYNGNPIGTELSRGTNFIEVEATVHPDFGQYVAQIQSNGDSICCTVDSIELISGTVDGYFFLPCDNPRWPDTSLTSIIALPSNGNTFHCRNVATPFTVKFHFGV